jgi:hypothetical protein
VKRALVCLTALLASSAGCRSWHSYRPITILVRDAETRQPIDGARVRLGYFLLVAPFAPSRTAGMTGADGTVDLVAAPYEGRAVMFASADGYFSEGMQALNDELIRACDPDRGKPRGLVLIEMYAEPAAQVELVVPLGFRGLIEVEVQPDPPPAVRQRSFRVAVDPSGRARIKGPALLRRAECVDYRLTWAAGTSLPAPPEGDAVGWWRLDSGGAGPLFFFVGTRQDHDECFRLLYRQTADGGWEFDARAAQAWQSRLSFSPEHR